MDGRQGGRLGCDAAHRQGYRGQRALDQCAGDDGGVFPVAGAARRGIRKAGGEGEEKFSEILERRAWVLLRRNRRSGWCERCVVAAESTVCGVVAGVAVERGAAACRRGYVRETFAHVVRAEEFGAG